MQTTAAAWLPPRELISFHIVGQPFCIDIMAVREIRGWTPVTPLPHAPVEFRGVLNLRGAILPILDLGAQLGLATGEPTKQNVIIVVQANGQTMGLLVDGVSDILTVTADMIHPAPEMTAASGVTQVEGLIDIDGCLLTLLRLEALLPVLNKVAA